MEAMRSYAPDFAMVYERLDPKMRQDYVNSDLFKSYFEHTDTCAGCKTSCCEQTPCGHSANDFDFAGGHSLKVIKEHLDLGKTSINVHVGGGLWTNAPKLGVTLSARAEGAPIVTFGKPSGKCSQLTPDGCAYTFDERPTLAILFKKTRRHGCRNLADMRYDSNQWVTQQRQAVLSQLLHHFYDAKKPLKEGFRDVVEEARRDEPIKHLLFKITNEK